MIKFSWCKSQHGHELLLVRFFIITSRSSSKCYQYTFVFFDDIYSASNLTDHIFQPGLFPPVNKFRYMCGQISLSKPPQLHDQF